MSRQDSSPSLGNAELRLLNYVSEHGPISVREVADTLGIEQGYVRTTVLQMMERLRKKGLLEREKVGGAFRYRAARSKQDVMRSVIERFVDQSLGGSFSPLIAYLGDSGELDADDIAHLTRIIERLEEK